MGEGFQFRAWACGECGAEVPLGEEHVCGVSVADVEALKERVERHSKEFRYLGTHNRTVLLLCDQYLKRKGAD